MSAVTACGALLVLAGLGGAGFGLYAILRGGRDGGQGGGLGPIPERGIHILVGLRIILFSVICLAAGLYAILRLS